MSESAARTEATVRRSRWPGWIWAVPLAALAIVGWLLFRHFAERGPTVTVSFVDSGGAKPGDTKVEYKGIAVGEVADVTLSKDLGHVEMTLRLHDDIKPALREGTRFWIVGAAPKLTDPSTLKAVVAGPHIEMDPGKGKPARRFVGLEHAPQVKSGSAGLEIVLEAHELGSIGAGSTISYLGLDVGKVESARLAADGSSFEIAAFVDAPYDKLVHEGSRFWAESGIEISTENGIKANLPSLSGLVAGAIAFDTSESARGTQPAKSGERFVLYPGKDEARDAPIGEKVPFTVRFDGAVGDLSQGAAVKLKGFRVGSVESIGLEYDAASDTLKTPVTIEIEPARLHLEGATPASEGNPGAAVTKEIDALVRQGLRARLDRSTPVIGGRIVTLDFAKDAAPATLTMGGAHPEIPTAPSGDIGAITASAHSVIAKIDGLPIGDIGKSVADAARQVDQLVASPEIAESVHHLDGTLATLDRTVNEASGKIPSLIASLRQTAEAAQRTVASVDQVLGGRGGGEQDRNIPDALNELSNAARAIRALANYLDRHPEALIEGKAGGGR